MNQRLILSLPGDTNMLDLADALHSIGLGISAIAGRDGEIVVGKLMYHEPATHQAYEHHCIAQRVSDEQ